MLWMTQKLTALLFIWIKRADVVKHISKGKLGTALLVAVVNPAINIYLLSYRSH